MDVETEAPESTSDERVSLCGSADPVPHVFITTPSGVRWYQAAAALLAAISLCAFWATTSSLYLVPDTVVITGVEVLTLLGIAFAALWKGMARHELWLDANTGRYRARWNRLSAGVWGTFSDFAGASAQSSSALGMTDVWLKWKSMDRNPLLLTSVASPDEAERLASDLSALSASAAAIHAADAEPEKRPASKRRDGRASWGQGAFLLLVSIPMAGFGLHHVIVGSAFQNHGQVLRATVTNRLREAGRSGPTYSVSYTYVVNGRKYNGDSVATRGQYRRAEYHSPITIEYLPEDPRVSRLPDGGARVGMLVLVGMFVFVFLGVANVVAGLREINAPGALPPGST